MSFPITHFLWLIFDLPNGSIWSNLWANIVWIPITAVTVWILHKKQIKKIEEKFDDHHEKIKALLDERTKTSQS